LATALAAKRHVRFAKELPGVHRKIGSEKVAAPHKGLPQGVFLRYDATDKTVQIILSERFQPVKQYHCAPEPPGILPLVALVLLMVGFATAGFAQTSEPPKPATRQTSITPQKAPSLDKPVEAKQLDIKQLPSGGP
jgi:hypothetical protein